MDSTGITVTNRGDWMREKWKVHRGWIKVHAMIDGETNQILGLEVTDESIQDELMFKPLIDQVTTCGNEIKIQQVFGDGAYDWNHIFYLLEDYDIQSGVKTRINAD